MSDQKDSQEKQALGQATVRAANVIRGKAVTPADDPALAWLAKGYGRPIESAFRLTAGPEAGEDAGGTFYEIAYAEGRLALRADGMRAYLTTVSKLVNLPKLSRVLEGCHFSRLLAISAENLRATVLTGTTWLRVAEGEPEVTAEGVEYLSPGNPDEAISEAALVAAARQLQVLLGRPVLSDEPLGAVQVQAATPGQVVARIVSGRTPSPPRDVFGRPLVAPRTPLRPQAGEGVTEADGQFRAERYGYVVLADGRLAVISPVHVSRDGLEARWLVLDRRPSTIEADNVHAGLAEVEVTEPVPPEALERLLALVRQGASESLAMLLVSGMPPVHGQDSRVEILVDMAPREGSLKPDGSLDFQQSQFSPNVRIGRPVARLVPPTTGRPGRSVRGRILLGRDGRVFALRGGAGIEVTEEASGQQLFTATAAGAFKYVPGEIAVVDTLIIEGNVGFDTGNLQFGGEIVIKGNVGQGFTVKAGADVTVFGSVDARAVIAAGGSVRVGGGILGRNTKVVAVGNVEARVVEEAQVRAGHDVLLRSHATQGLLRAGNKVRVAKAEGPHGGSLVGGECWGLGGIYCHRAGNATAVRTELVVGIDLEQAQQLDLLERKLAESQKMVLRELTRFGLTTVDVKAIQRRVAASTGPQQKVLARGARQLGEAVQAHQQLLAERNEIEAGLGTQVRGAVIKISEQAFPGVCLRVGDHQRQLKETMTAAQFHVSRDVLRER